ncbi:TIM barrel protein [Nakamurella sp. YIM 132087]|uniref:TIM barrel protein n=1 Tax=Nakamurella alba TaxID=2665158 RepID=A0A7K1FMN2_9ACTN|nr:TIM barrel protein [Nakamurella alba]
MFATCWTSAGDAAPDRRDLRSPLPLRDRVEAAAAAGFTGFGILSDDLPAAIDKYGLPGIRALLDDNGITDLELESIPDWWVPDGPRAETSLRVRELMLYIAEVLQPRHLKITPDGQDRPWDAGRWAERFAGLAAQAESVGTRLGIEFFPWSNIKTLHDGLRLVADAGHPAGGIIVDAWHIFRAGTPVEDLATVPVELILGVELDDADPTVVGTMFEDTVHRRRYCGEGTFDLAGMIDALRRAGWAGPWGVEILSDDHIRLPVGEAMRRAGHTARAVLGAG